MSECISIFYGPVRCGPLVVRLAGRLVRETDGFVLDVLVSGRVATACQDGAERPTSDFVDIRADPLT
ncbi:hypothetical protein AB2M62_13390 [Sphingomonas sp. MMS12-HWE2-04]|uniref:hypothetical protein n=1 Tax=Sphingomonas sp. MMS12-HWE2-04 TaxID=3234199 RepID=UPI00384ABC09